MCAKSVADSPAAPAVDIATLLRELEHIGSAKFLNVAAVTFLFWDILLTLRDEARYIWRRRWSPVCVLYMITRYCTAIIIGICSAVLFHPSISPNSCDALYRVNTALGTLAFCAMMVLLLLRVWIMWDRSTRMLVFLLIVFGLFQLVPVVLLGSSAEDMRAVPNPLPGILTGCVVPFTAQFQWVKLLLCHLLYESTLFILTVLQVWRSSRQGMVTPVLGYIVCDGTGYFLVVIGVECLTAIGVTHKSTLPAAISSGMFLSMLSSVCCRLVLRLRSYSPRASAFSILEDDDSTHFTLNDFASARSSTVFDVPPPIEPASEILS